MVEQIIIDYGILSLIPPILAVILAMWTKNILVSLFVTVFVGATMVASWNPIVGFTSIIKVYMFDALGDSVNTQGLFMMVVIGGFVALLTQSGGASAFTKRVTKFVNSRAKCETGIWLGGLFVWFTDNGNSLIVGPIFEALGEKLKVSREKFAYILDCTTTPICAMIPIIGWGVYTMSLIQVELDAANVTDTSSWEVFTQGISFNFYSILTLFMAGLMAMTQWDYGPMLSAQNRAMKTGKTLRDGGTPMRDEAKKIELPKGVEPKLYTVLVPLAILLIVMFAYLTSVGLWTTRVAGSDIRTGIASGFLCATFSLIIICMKEKIYKFTESLNIIMNGMRNMMFMCVVLVLSWSVSGVIRAMGTSTYLIELSEGFLNPALLPVITFLIGGVMSLATGTSWGTMAILMPIVLPIAMNFDVSLPIVAAAIISGSVFGDHCSAISDTTMLASIGSASDHIDHFKTQIPYALTVGAISVVMFWSTAWASSMVILPVSVVALIVVVFMLHKLSVGKQGKVTQSAVGEEG